MFLLVGILIILNGCKKYPENKFPILILPPEMCLNHLVGAQLVEYKRDDKSLMDSLHRIYKEIKIARYRFHLASASSDSYPHMEIDYFNRNSQYSYMEYFGVQFSNNKKYIIFHKSHTLGQGWTAYKILKLTKTELKYVGEYKNHKYEVHFKK